VLCNNTCSIHKNLETSRQGSRVLRFGDKNVNTMGDEVVARSVVNPSADWWRPTRAIATWPRRLMANAVPPAGSIGLCRTGRF
jgi:hypothetical protein